MLAPARDLVFVSYSHANPKWLNRLLVLLKPFVRRGQLQVWADPYIRIGDNWQREIDAALARTRVGVVLLTPALLASDFIADVEVPSLLRSARANLLTLIVVPIERHVEGSTRFDDGDLTDYQWPWSPSDPLDELERARRNQALVTVTNAIVQTKTRDALPSPSLLSVAPRATAAVAASALRLATVHWVPALPPNYLEQGEALDTLKHAVLGRSAVIGVSPGPSAVGLHGRGGIGKTVLAQGLVYDEEVRRAFADGIYWISVGQQPRVESLQAELAEQFGGRANVEDVPGGARLLQERLHGKACLLVLDDIWDLLHAKAFDVLGAQSRLLVTTRDSSLLTALGAQGVPLDSLTPAAALELMARWAGVDPLRLPSEAKDVAKEVDYLPLGLSLAGAQIKEGRRWEDLLAALREGTLAYLDHPYGSVLKSIQTSVDVLQDTQAARYIELAVFPEGADVPVSIVEHLWHATSGLDARETRALLTRLAARNLLTLTEATSRSDRRESSEASRSRQDHSEVVVLHDLQYDFTRLAIEGLPALHGRLIDALRQTIRGESIASSGAPDPWTMLPDAPDYAWQFLAHHLSEAGRGEELEHLLTNPDWLFARLTRFSLRALLADYRNSLTDAGLRSIRDALVLSAHVLVKDPTALTSQLAGRLLPSTDQRVHRLTDHSPSAFRNRPFLHPKRRCLTPPGGPLLQTLEGHSGDVTAVTLLPDGQRALSGSADSTLKLWDLASGAVLQTFEGHRRAVTAVTLLPDGQRALSCGSDHTLKLWNLASGAVLQTYKDHQGVVSAVTLLPEGLRALSGSWDGTLKLWDVATGDALRTFKGHTDAVSAVTLLPDGQRALSGSHDGTLKLWDVMSGAMLLNLEGPTGAVTAMMLLPDGRRALTGDEEGGLKLWDLATGGVQSFEGHSKWIRAVTPLPDGQHALSASADRTLKLWDLASGAVLQTFDGHTGTVYCVTLLPDKQHALSASADRTLKLWDLASAATLQTFERHTGGIRAVSLLPEEQRALSGGDDGALKLWDLASGAVLQTLQGHTGGVTTATVLPDGRRVLSGSDDRTLKLWDLESGAVLQTFDGHIGGITAATLLPDRRRALSGSSDHTLKLWDLASGVALQSFEGHTDWVTALTVLPDGRRALSGSKDHTLRLWDLSSGALLQTFKDHRLGVTAVTLLPDGQRAVSASADRTLKVWDLVSGVALQTLSGHSGRVSAVVVLAGGQHALSASADRTLKVWDLASGVVLQTLESHTGGVEAVMALPDSQRALSGSDDGMLKLWDLASGEVLATFFGEAPFTSVALSTLLPCGVAGDSLGRVHILGIENLV